jgi:glutamyl-tRNA reductase
MNTLRLLSMSHRDAPLERLERIAMVPRAVERHLRRLRRHGIEAVLLSTCNRAEFYWISRDPDDDAAIVTTVAERCGEDTSGSEHVVRRDGRAAAAHLFRVAAGLESMVLGEAEIMGQVRAALEISERQRTAGRFLPGLFRAALRAGGRARAETAIGAGAMSVASASVRALMNTHRDLATRTVFVVGAGLSGRKTARHLLAEGAGRVVLFNRTAERSRAVAEELGCEWAPIETWTTRLGEADAIVTAVQTTAPLLDAATLAAARGADPARTLALIDLSMPRAIDPACAALPRVVHHDLSRLEDVIAHNRAQREGEVEQVEALLEHELAVFETQTREFHARPVLSELRGMAETIRRREIERALSEGGDRAEMLERATRRIVEQLLHAPTRALRRGDLAADGAPAHTLRVLFGLDDGAEAPVTGTGREREP